MHFHHPITQAGPKTGKIIPMFPDDHHNFLRLGPTPTRRSLTVPVTANSSVPGNPELGRPGLLQDRRGTQVKGTNWGS